MNNVIGFDPVISTLSSIKKKMRLIEKSKLHIGWFPGLNYVRERPVAQIAYWLEFGTSRMHPRPFLRPAIDKNLNSWLDFITTSFSKIIAEESDIYNGFNSIGERISDHIKEEIKDGDHLKLHPVTLGLRRWKRENNTQLIPGEVVWKMFDAAAKGKTGKGEFAEPDSNITPLQDTGFLLSTLTWKMKVS